MTQVMGLASSRNTALGSSKFTSSALVRGMLIGWRRRRRFGFFSLSWSPAPRFHLLANNAMGDGKLLSERFSFFSLSWSSALRFHLFESNARGDGKLSSEEEYEPELWTEGGEACLCSTTGVRTVVLDELGEGSQRKDSWRLRVRSRGRGRIGRSTMESSSGDFGSGVVGWVPGGFEMQGAWCPGEVGALPSITLAFLESEPPHNSSLLLNNSASSASCSSRVRGMVGERYSWHLNFFDELFSLVSMHYRIPMNRAIDKEAESTHKLPSASKIFTVGVLRNATVELDLAASMPNKAAWLWLYLET
jgi:hypothetical protein